MNPKQEQEHLRQDIERVRGDLADTVDALVAKTDVKRRVGEKADEVKANVAEKAGQVKATVAVKGDQLKETVAERAQEAKYKANIVAGQATEQAGHAVEVARRKPVPVAVVAAVLAALIALLIRQRTR